MRKRISAVFLCAVLCLCGCRQAVQEEAGCKVYYREFVVSGLRSYTTVLTQTETEAQIDELWTALCKSDYEEGIRSVVGNGITLLRYELEQKNLSLYFSEEYKEQDNISELLLRAAAVKTFTQLEGIDTVTLFVGENPLTNSSSQPLGAQKSSDYTDIIGKGMTDTRTAVLTLYFADETGTSLVRTTQEAAYESAYSIEKDIMNKLIAGPAAGDCAATLPENLQLISIGIKDRVCYVNFDSAFISDALTLDANLIIYSIVNSLTELSGIQKVQFMINGEADWSFRGISLKRPFERNLDLVSLQAG